MEEVSIFLFLFLLADGLMGQETALSFMEPRLLIGSQVATGHLERGEEESVLQIHNCFKSIS